jgi:cysteinyl-tRNA synthetase
VFSYVGHLSMDDEKMSKSIGNVIKARDFINRYGPSVLRQLLTQTHYSKPINITNESIVGYNNNVKKMKNTLINSISKILDSEHDFIEENSSDYQLAIDFILDDIDISSVTDLVNKLMKYLNINEVDKKFLVKFYDFYTILKMLGYKIEILLTNEIKMKFEAARINKDFIVYDELKKGILYFE